MKALIIDVETTGLLKPGAPIDKQPEITEYCGALYDLKPAKGPKLIKQLHVLLKPRLPVTAEITRITGITNKMLEDAKRFGAVASSIKLDIERAPAVIAHNVRFDRSVIACEFQRLGVEIEWPRLICTIEQTMHLVGHRMNLNALHEHLFGEKFTGAHRADVDVAAVARISHALFHKGMIE